MPGEFPPNAVEATSEAKQAEEVFNPQLFLDELGIGGLAEQLMLDHEGNPTTLLETMRDCAPARASVEVQVETFAELGVDPVRGMSTHLKRMSEKARESAPEFRTAKKKLINEQELASTPRESDNTVSEKSHEVDKARDLERPNLRSTVEAVVPVQEIVKQRGAAVRETTKETDAFPVDTFVRSERPTKQLNPQTEKVHTKVTPRHAPKTTTVGAVEQKPVPITSKPEPKHNHIATNPAVVVEQVTKPTLEQTKPETPIVNTLKPTVSLYATIRDVIYPKLPDIEASVPDVSTAHTDGEPLSCEFDIFTNPETAFELPDFEKLEIALPFIEFQQLEQTAQEAEYSDTEEIPSVVDQLYLHFETLEPGLAEESSEILSIVMEKIQELESQETGVYRDALEQELEIICKRMLVCIGIEPSEEIVKNLLQVLKIENQKQLALSAQIAYDAGTHERKNAMFQSAYSLPFEISQKLSHSLGRHTLILAS